MKEDKRERERDLFPEREREVVSKSEREAVRIISSEGELYREGEVV